jgi:hypothetical protein
MCTLLCSVLLLAACTTAGAPAQDLVPRGDTRSCARNFAISGNALEGYSFRTSHEQGGRTLAAVFARTERSLVTRGYQVTNSNRESGTISSTAQRQRLTLNAAIGTTRTRDIRVDLVAQLAGGTTTAPAAVIKEFCDILSDSFTEQQ